MVFAGSRKKRKLTSDSESGDSSSSGSASDSDSEISLDTEEEERREKLKAERKARRKAKGNKRRRIKEQKDSSDEKGRIETDSDIVRFFVYKVSFLHKDLNMVVLILQIISRCVTQIFQFVYRL